MADMAKVLNNHPMGKKAPAAADRHVGVRVRLRRLEMSMSQEELGDALGLTFQQVQKHEKGANRIGASRLWQLARALDVPVDYFFEGLDTKATGKISPERDKLTRFITEQRGMAIIDLWNITPVNLRNGIIIGLRAFIGGQEP